MPFGRARLSFIAASLGFALFVGACSDSPIGPDEPDLPASGRLGVTPKTDTIFVTDSFATSLQLTPTVNIRGSDVATPQAPTSVKWSSRDTAVAVVNDSGRVIPRGIGTATIVAEAGGQDAEARVSIIRAEYRIVVTSPTSGAISGVVGDSVRVNGRALLPNDSAAPGVRLRYVSSNPAVATVDSTGLVRFVGAGTAEIRVVDAAGNSSPPVVVTSFARVLAAVDAGGDHNCGIVGPGRLYCWGLNNFGQLALPRDSTCFPLGVDDQPLPCQLSPKRTAPTLAFTSVTAGEEFSCGIVGGGAAYCWGLDTLGQLGGGRPRARAFTATPAAITGSVSFASIDAGQRHACGMELGANRAYCWGYDSLGQLGDATLFIGGVSSTTPIPVVTADQTPLPLTQVAAGGLHSCGVAPGGAAWCWGDNTAGQLGTNAPGGANVFPAPVAGGLSFSSVSAGGAHSCGIATGGQAFCWGRDVSGQLGRGAAGADAPTPVAAASGLAFTQISAGLAHTCAVTAAGAAYCWGSNVFGQIGRVDATATLAPNPTPVAVPGGHIFTRVSAGRFHSCGVVTTPATDAGVWCWGGNFYGALGNQLQAAVRGVPVRAVPLQ